MNIFIILFGFFVALISALEEASHDQIVQGGSSAQVDAESNQNPVETPTATTKVLDIKKILDTDPNANVSRNVTINSTRPDARQSESPTPIPTFPLTPAPTTAPTPEPWVTKTIGHDQVKPFAQPDPVTISEKAGVKFKPQLQRRTGCDPYPAVNDVGETSGGLKPTGNPRGGCRGSDLGSQVYGRATWINGVWAIMYSWYFPKDSPSPKLGHRHDWEHVVVFIDNPDVPDSKILGCSASSHSGYYKYKSCPSNVIDGTSLKVRYRHDWPKNHDIDVTGDTGEFQDLIMWDQMTDDARRALNSVRFGSAVTPMNDGNFLRKLEKAWPF